jgi:hypothetical protein
VASSEDDENEISTHLAKIDEIMDIDMNADESNNGKQNSLGGQSSRRSMKMRLSSVEATPNRSFEAATEAECKTQGAEKSQIMWVDPQEEAERRKLAESLEAETQYLQQPEQSNNGQVLFLFSST